MTDDELKAIEARAVPFTTGSVQQAFADRRDLLADVRRLQRRLGDALEVALTPDPGPRYSTEAVDALLDAVDGALTIRLKVLEIIANASRAVRASREPKR